MHTATKKIICLSILPFFLFWLGNAFAQLDSYTITRTAPNCACYSNISGTGTAVTSWRNGTSTDDNLSNTINIGFSFPYEGGLFTQFRVSTEGFITFNTATNANGADLPAFGMCANTIESYTYDNTKFSTVGAGGTLATLAPFYNDLICDGYSLNTSMHYLLSGSSPNRELTVQWRGMANDWTGDSDCSISGGSLNFQVKIYETSGNIEFYYSTMTQTSVWCSGSGTYSIYNTYTSGINSSTLSAAPTITQLITQQTANTSTFNNTVQNSLTTLPSANSKITFTRTPPAPPSAVPGCALINFPANASANLCLNTILSWGNTGGVPTGYDVYFGTAVAPPLVSANQGSTYYGPGALSTNTTYYWKIVPKNSFGDAGGCSTLSFSTGSGDVSPTSISSSAGNPICVGTPTTLTIVGGSTSAGSVFNWTAPFIINLGCKVNPSYPLFSANCMANSYNITPGSAGTYRFDVFVRGCNGTTSCTTLNLVVNALNNSQPTGVTATPASPICAGISTSLDATGGTLGVGATTEWYTGSCGGTLVGTGDPISVSPLVTTTYYVRRTGGTGPCPNTTTCRTVTITVQAAVGNNTVSTAQTICSGQTPAGLTGTAPTGGTGAYTYQWQSSTDGVSYGAAGGTNNTQNYSPGVLTQTTWFRRNVSSGACTGTNSSTSAAIIVTVNPVPAAAGSITGTASVCQGQNGVSYSVPAIGGATGYNWVLPSGATIASGTNTNSITVNFSGSASAGNITVEGTNGCGPGTSSSFAVAINTISTLPTASASPPSVCSGGTSSLSITGGTLGTGGVWNWYTGSCGGTFIGAGTPISVNPGSTTTYYVRGQGTCNTTACATVTVTVPGNGGAGTWVWQGTIDNNWFNQCNWDKGSLPDGASDVVIPGGTPFNPTISGATATCRTRSINVGNGGNLTINTSTGGQCVVTL